MERCTVKRCKKTAKSKGLCATHYGAQWKKNNLMQYLYQTAKDNAKRRGKEFTITFDEYTELVTNSTYLAGRGRKSESLHLDRKEEHLGYTKDNLQVMKNCDNVRKSLAYRFGSNGKPTDFHVITHRPAEVDPDVPF